MDMAEIYISFLLPNYIFKLMDKEIITILHIFFFNLDL